MKKQITGDGVMYSGLSYAKELIELTGYPNYDIEKLVPMYNQSVQDREDNFITYRDVRTFKSIHTGQESCLGNKTWLEMLDV
jgi:trimethylamine monooxygenase